MEAGEILYPDSQSSSASRLADRLADPVSQTQPIITLQPEHATDLGFFWA